MRQFNPNSRDYQYSDKIIAGIKLSGSDVKSLRYQTLPWGSARVDVINGVPKLLNFTIPRYKFATNLLDTTDERDLLLNTSEIAKLISYKRQKYMLVPVAIFLQGRWFKLEIGIGRKLKKHDKRAQIKAREIQKQGKDY